MRRSWASRSCSTAPPSTRPGPARFPGIDLDISLLVADGVAAGALVSCAASAGGALLRGVAVFDVYAGKGVADGQRPSGFACTSATCGFLGWKRARRRGMPWSPPWATPAARPSAAGRGGRRPAYAPRAPRPVHRGGQVVRAWAALLVEQYRTSLEQPA